LPEFCNKPSGCPLLEKKVKQNHIRKSHEKVMRCDIKIPHIEVFEYIKEVISFSDSFGAQQRERNSIMEES
jgi:hypothetical protein